MEKWAFPDQVAQLAYTTRESNWEESIAFIPIIYMWELIFLGFSLSDIWVALQKSRLSVINVHIFHSMARANLDLCMINTTSASRGPE